MFQGKYFEQLEGAAMGSPISPIVANLYIENFEVEWSVMKSTLESPQELLEKGSENI